MPRSKTWTAYTLAEDTTIIKYLCQQGFENVRGNKVWKGLEALKLCPNRSFQSLRNHFLKSLIKNFEYTYKDLLQKHNIKLPKWLTTRATQRKRLQNRNISGLSSSEEDSSVAIERVRIDRRNRRRLCSDNNSDIEFSPYNVQGKNVRSSTPIRCHSPSIESIKSQEIDRSQSRIVLVRSTDGSSSETSPKIVSTKSPVKLRVEPATSCAISCSPVVVLQRLPSISDAAPSTACKPLSERERILARIVRRQAAVIHKLMKTIQLLRTNCNCTLRKNRAKRRMKNAKRTKNNPSPTMKSFENHVALDDAQYSSPGLKNEIETVEEKTVPTLPERYQHSELLQNMLGTLDDEQRELLLKTIHQKI